MANLRVNFNAEKFNIQLKKIVYKMNMDLKAALAFCVGVFFKTVIEATPIKTGSLRLNWQIGIGSPPDEENRWLRLGESPWGMTSSEYNDPDRVHVHPKLWVPAFTESTESMKLRDAIQKIKDWPSGEDGVELPRIYIRNTTQKSNPYVLKAEEFGWKITQPYHMALFAKNVAEEELMSYLKRAKLGQSIDASQTHMDEMLSQFSVDVVMWT